MRTASNSTGTALWNYGHVLQTAVSPCTHAVSIWKTCSVNCTSASQKNRSSRQTIHRQTCRPFSEGRAVLCRGNPCGCPVFTELPSMHQVALHWQAVVNILLRAARRDGL